MKRKELQELAAAHALGALDPEDQNRIETLLTQSPEAGRELAGFLAAAAAVAVAHSLPEQPPAALRERILDRVASQTRKGTSAVPQLDPTGFRFVPRDAPGWQSGPIPGLRSKLLSVSRDMGYQVVLAELAPGGRFPEHDHHSSEQLFIVSGHLHTEGRVLGPGDFLHAEPGTHHHELISPDGCTALLITRAPVTA